MKKLIERCAYCERRRKIYRCTAMLSSHCQECCPSNCSGKKKPNLIDDAFIMAREMGGTSWPSADCTRWAMTNLLVRLVHHFETKELMNVCGIKAPTRKKILSDMVAKAEDQLR